MKKSFLSIVTLVAVAMMILFASCTKDGVYKPKKKISKIYETVQTDPNPERVLKETWTWNGKLLSKIDYGDDDFVTFAYDKNQLTNIYNGDSRTELTYDSKGKFIDNIKCYEDNELVMTYTFQHDKKLISSYTVEYADNSANKAKVARLIENVFRFIAPEVSQNEVANYLKSAENNGKGGTSYTVYLTYDGKNITQQIVKRNDAQVTYAYTYYEEYLNPFYGLLAQMELSKNATNTCVITQEGMPDFNYSYTYKADGKVPTEVTENSTWTISYGGINSSHTVTTFTEYEYLD